MRVVGPLRRLWLEHRLIEQVLTTLDDGCLALRRGAPLDARFFLEAVAFLRGFADKWHHAREEGQLVPLLDECGISHERVPVGDVLDEHRHGRALVKLLARAAPRLEEGSRLAAADIVGGASLYTALLRRHIAMEDRAFYPLAAASLEPIARAELEARFAAEEARLGPLTPERFRGLAETLRRRLEAALAPEGRPARPPSVDIPQAHAATELALTARFRAP